MSSNPIILALDTPSSIKALNAVRTLKITGVAFKVGFELFVSQGPRVVEKILSHDVRVFLDLKFHDIPQTVAKAAEVATAMGVWMFNVHASGGPEMMKRAKEASLEKAAQKKVNPPLVLGVTVLTSLNDLNYLNVNKDVEGQVLDLARLAKSSGLDGVVASAREASLLKESLGPEFCLVTPGIRSSLDPKDDQKRTYSPLEAVQAGSHYLVIGRPVLSHPKPLEAIENILKTLKAGASAPA